MRCCKDLGIASDLWDPSFIQNWKENNTEKIWCSNEKTGEKRMLWRRKDRSFIQYPWVEQNPISQSAKQKVTAPRPKMQSYQKPPPPQNLGQNSYSQDEQQSHSGNVGAPSFQKQQPPQQQYQQQPPQNFGQNANSYSQYEQQSNTGNVGATTFHNQQQQQQQRGTSSSVDYQAQRSSQRPAAQTRQIPTPTPNTPGTNPASAPKQIPKKAALSDVPVNLEDEAPAILTAGTDYEGKLFF